MAICFQTFAYNVPDYLLYEDLSDDETVPDDETVSVGDDYAPLYDGDSADDEAPDYNEVLVAEQVLINGEEENPTDNDHFVINGKFETKIGSENNKFLVYYFILKLAIATNKTIGMGCKGTPYDFRQSTPMQKVTDKFGLEEIIYRIYDGLELEKEEFDSLQLFVKAKSYNPDDREVRGVHMRVDQIDKYIIQEKIIPQKVLPLPLLFQGA